MQQGEAHKFVPMERQTACCMFVRQAGADRRRDLAAPLGAAAAAATMSACCCRIPFQVVAHDSVPCFPTSCIVSN